MSESRSIAAAMAALSVVVGCAVCSVDARADSAPQPGAPAQAALFDAALQAYARQDFGTAYSGLVVLANAGHVDAARIAWWMQRQGSSLYGREFAASAAQRRAWAEAAQASIRRELGEGMAPIATADSNLPDGCIDSALSTLAVEYTLAAAQRR